MPEVDSESIRFADRHDAGRRLARRLLHWCGRSPAVLALPRGGVPVAFEIARALDAPLDLVLVRKVGVPAQPELAMGAVVDGDDPQTVVNADVVAALEIPDAVFRREAERQLAEIERRRSVYLAGRKPVALAGTTAIVVDDGIATGATAEAALRAVRRRGPRTLILATPVAAPEAVDRLAPHADEIVCLSTPRLFGAIGGFYDDFTQLDDDAVIDLLRRSAPVGGPSPHARSATD
jgi:putative phosphoribosyl transferase